MELGNFVFGISRGSWPVPRIPSYEGPIFNLIDHLNQDKGSVHLESVEYSNDVFSIRNYWWGDCTCGVPCDEEGDPLEEHKETCLLVTPNFYHFKSGLKIMWYKYPLRDSYASRKFSGAELMEIINECIKSSDPLDWMDEL